MYTKTVEESCAEKSARVGYALKVVYPDRDQLFLDYDSEEAYDRGRELLKIAVAEGLVSGYTSAQSPSGRGWHVTAALPGPLESFHAGVALRAALGSDPTRELLALVRYEDQGEGVSCFFERVEP